jgi:hypothetical protein
LHIADKNKNNNDKNTTPIFIGLHKTTQINNIKSTTKKTKFEKFVKFNNNKNYEHMLYIAENIDHARRRWRKKR